MRSVCDEACPDGFYQSSACTATEDRICSPCSSCKADEFELGSCSRFQDTQCKSKDVITTRILEINVLVVCSTCKYGTYVSDKCSSTTDTACSLCTSCSSLEFEMSECTEGRDTICGTCEQCTFASKMTEIECRRELYYVWHDSNCCFDSEGEKVNNNFDSNNCCWCLYNEVIFSSHRVHSRIMKISGFAPGTLGIIGRFRSVIR